MSDLLNSVLSHAKNQADEHLLRSQIGAHIAALRASAGQGKRAVVHQAEQAVKRSPSDAFSFDTSGYATLNVNGQTWAAGCFATASIEMLKRQAQNLRGEVACARARLWVLDGACPATDIGSLQATSDDTLFQVASQFNCLEAPDEYITAVANYFDDYTQGPRASISAFPATLLRHYSAPDKRGSYFVQHTDGPQIDLLEEACGRKISRNGYFTGKGITNKEKTVRSLEENFEKINVGIHDGAEVVFGYNWDGKVEAPCTRKIAQVFTSTVAGGGYDARITMGESLFLRASRQLLRAAYLGTLLAAAGLKRERVLLTLIGGGVFANPIDLIWESILWAVDEVQPFLAKNLDVVVNGYSLHRLVPLDDLLPDVIERGGAIVCLGETGLMTVKR
ncbi:MAG: hypothetical protein K2W95_34405 [Candidatus Obscuribacterales bacterium]|nr:hypothetical protein [Candidatus Obscuribacterales bacterium]